MSNDNDKNHEDSIPLGQPRFRWDELTSANNKYERAVAAPSDEVLVSMWRGWAIVSLVCGAIALCVFCAMLAKQKVRQNAFNVYIMAIALPDFVPAILCGVACALNAAAGHIISESACKFQAVYVTFNVTCNSWMNGLICWEVHRLLRCSMNRERYFPPSIINVLQKSAVVYVASALISSIPILPFDWILVNADVVAAGAGCVSIYFVRLGRTREKIRAKALMHLFFYLLQNVNYYDLESEFFFWFVVCPLLMGIPYVYVMYVALDVHLKDLLPPRGYRRELAIYYFKIIFVVFFVWMPYLVVFVALRGRVHPWVVWTMGAVAHSQTMISAVLACQKSDIREAVAEFWCRGCCNKKSTAESEHQQGEGKEAILRLTGESVCHGDFPQQRDDFGFDGETESMSSHAQIDSVPLEESAPPQCEA